MMDMLGEGKGGLKERGVYRVRVSEYAIEMLSSNRISWIEFQYLIPARLIHIITTIGNYCILTEPLERVKSKTSIHAHNSLSRIYTLFYIFHTL